MKSEGRALAGDLSHYADHHLSLYKSLWSLCLAVSHNSQLQNTDKVVDSVHAERERGVSLCSNSSAEHFETLL